MNRIDLSLPGGLPFTQDTLNFMQKTYSDCLTAIGSVLGDYVVISGCENNNGIIAPGWVAVNGEVLYTPGGSGDTVYIAETSQSVIFEDGQTKPVYFNRTLEFGNDAVILYWENFVHLKKLTEMLKPEDWHYVTRDELANNIWKSPGFGSDANATHYIRYRKNPTGMVTIQGSIYPTTPPQVIQNIFTPPAGYIPLKTEGIEFTKKAAIGLTTDAKMISVFFYQNMLMGLNENTASGGGLSFMLNYYTD